MLNLVRLTYFIEVARQGSLSAAAESLRVAQPALSYQILQLERSTGLSLFERHPRGMRLTEHGQYLLPKARAIVDAIDALEAELKDRARVPERPVVTLALISSWATTYAPQILSKAAKALPDVALRLLEVRNEEALRMIAAQETDLGVVILPASADPSTKLIEEDLFLVSATSDDKADEVEFKSIDSMDLVLPTKANPLREIIDDAFTRNGVRLSSIVEVDGQDTVKNIILEGHYNSILAWNSVAQECKTGVLFARRITRPRLTRSIHLLRNKSFSKGTWETFREIILEIVR